MFLGVPVAASFPLNVKDDDATAENAAVAAAAELLLLPWYWWSDSGAKDVFFQMIKVIISFGL